MGKKRKPKIKVIRNGEPLDPDSTQIRSDQTAKLKKDVPPEVRRVEGDDAVKLVSREPKQIYTAGKQILCNGCDQVSRSPRMYQYKQTSKGEIVLCEKCDENAEIRYRSLGSMLSIRRKFVRSPKLVRMSNARESN